MEMTANVTPNFSLTDRVVLVTGASRGIGRACALACAGAGADVIVGVRNPVENKALVKEIEAFGRRALAVRMDLADLKGVRAGIAEAHKHFDRIDVLVNNVGLGPENLAENVREADFDLTVNINLKGTFFTTQAVAKLMIAQKSGRIINISSQAGSVVLKGEAIYCMSKAAINHLTRCLAFEWAPHGITVNSVSPTFIFTDGTKPALADPQFHQHVLSHIPLGRIGDTIDVAGTVVFLASPAASLITGANILVDGGWSIA
jgi:NAD(P)-dependent dehydrogenase (short-subunit alcohol dehydrogenase family)